LEAVMLQGRTGPFEVESVDCKNLAQKIG
jgi:hypothetical protein